MGGGREDTDGHQPVSDAPSSRGRCSADAGAHHAGCGPGGQPAAVPAAAHGDTSGRKSRRRGRDGAGRDGGTTGISDEEQGAEAGRSKMSRRSCGTAHHAQRIDADTILSDGDPGCEGDPLMESVVKVFCVHCEPNFSLPWQRKRQFSSSSTGFVYSLAQRRILTNAHSVDHHTQVKVKKRGSDKKYVAKVLAMGAECDLALLTVEDDSFWTGVKEVRFGGLPRLQDSVIVVGFPIGGDTVSVTSGVVSRIEVTSYVHGAAELLGVQIDAAINAGNSGGPAFNARGQCVGIAFQSLRHEDAENIGYIIPPPVADHFIRDYERSGDYSGFPVLGIDWQKMESVHLRSALRMQPDQSGVLVRRVQPTSPLSQVVKQFDILMKFDGVVIANDGTVPFRSGERISFSYLVSQKYVGEEATLQIYSDGQVKEVTMKLDLPTRLIPFHIRNKPPAFFIIAGLVFTSVTVPYLRSEYGKDYDFDAPVSLLNRMIHHHADVPGQQVVVLGQVLAAELNIGYEDFTNCQVMKLNGAKVHNLKELVELVDSCTAPWLHFDLDHNQKVILPTQEARNATNPILAAHCIPSDRSNHLLDSSCTTAAAATDNSTGPTPATQPAADSEPSPPA